MKWISPKATRDEALTIAEDIAEQCGYQVNPLGDDRLELIGHDTGEHLVATFDLKTGRIADVVVVREGARVAPLQMELLPDKIREQLPPLYANEEIGLEAPAVVKFFTPDAGWTWYASEFDGEDTFFGLVVGWRFSSATFPWPSSGPSAARWACPSSAIVSSNPSLRELATPINRSEMPVERRNSPTPRREREFGFTANEVLFDRMSHQRFMNLFDDETTTIHRLTEEANSYGEFLFVTLSRPGSTGRIHVTFWGAGYHEYRERWLAEEWFWYFSNFPPAEDEPHWTVKRRVSS